MKRFNLYCLFFTELLIYTVKLTGSRKIFDEKFWVVVLPPQLRLKNTGTDRTYIFNIKEK